jgi:D-alanyl-D-alanine carboxypeptidase (penicillin-binding protein 5/6)
MRQATLPVAGTQNNKNTLLGRDGIVGVKSGTTLAAGGCFVFAARQRIGGRAITVIGAVLHQGGAGTQSSLITAALHATTALVESSRSVLTGRVVIRSGATLGSITAPWADTVSLQTARSLSLIGWPGLHVTSRIMLRPVKPPVNAGEAVGTVIVTAGRQRAAVGLVASHALPDPSLAWRLAHP